ncbi:MAG TPA: PAS domain S-box protein [Rubricoccaceae bacterium]|nr:PAS domain S-box protein [Rubricoccaceae bacterium]
MPRRAENPSDGERPRGEAVLRESVERLQRMTNVEGVGVLLFTDDGTLIGANDAFLAMQGYTREEVEAGTLTWRDLTPPEYVAASEEQVRKLAETGRIGPYEKEYFRKDGSRAWMLFVGAALGDGTFVEYCIDVSGRKRIEAALRESEERYRTLVQNIPDYAIFRLDPDGVVTEWTEGAQRVKGYAPEEVLGRHLAMLFTPEDVAAGEVERELAEAIATGRAEREGWRVRKDGVRIWVNEIATAIRGDDGALVGFTKISRDLTEKKRAEEALRESEERYRLLVENAREYAIFTLDPERRVTSWNPGAERILGWTEAEMLGHTGDLIFTEEDRAAGAPEQEVATALHEGQAANDRWHLRKDGSRFWSSGIMTPLRDGELHGFAKILRDRTEEKRAEDELRLLNETLEARVAERTAELEERTQQAHALAAALTMAEQRERKRVAQVLHDHIQQLLYAMQIKLGLLDRTTDPEHLHATAEEVRAHIEEALQATRTLTVELNPPVLQDEGLTASLRWLAVQMEEAHGLHVDVEAGGPCRIPSEDRRILLFQSVRELLFNVVKHAGTEHARVIVEEGPRTVTVRVEDEGRGFDPLLESNAFSTAEAVERNSGGYGLFSVQERLSPVGGTLGVDSSPGQGTRVTIVLPLAAMRRRRGT